MVLWVIGLSGAGKTTLSRAVHHQLKLRYPNTVMLDGDQVREIFGHDVGHTVEDRWKHAQRLSRLCRCLSEQGLHVVCAVLSIFHESQRWNRSHIPNYFEVYLHAPFAQLVQRDSRGLYQAALRGELKDVVGVDIAFPTPCQPDLVIQNDGTLHELLDQVETVMTRLPGLEAQPCYPGSSAA